MSTSDFLNDSWPRARQLAAAQGGRISVWQLDRVRVSPSRRRALIARGILIPTLPRVYAVGAPRTDRFALFCEAILYAGPGAALSHVSAGYWCGLLRYAGAMIHVSTPRRVRSLPGIHVHASRTLPRSTHRGLPVTTTTQTMLDIAHSESELAVLRGLGELTFQGKLDLDALWTAAGRGVRGGGKLRTAIGKYNPDYARLNDGIETDFYQLLVDAHFEPLPEPNVQLEPGLIVDFLFRDHRTVVETDGRKAHDQPEQQLDDARRDMRCRELGFQVLHYRNALIRPEPARVLVDLRRALDDRDP